jgi:hypothetical protein
MDKKLKKNSMEIKIEKLPIVKDMMGEYLKQCLEITWKGDKIEKININSSKLDMKAIMANHKLSVNTNQD